MKVLQKDLQNNSRSSRSSDSSDSTTSPITTNIFKLVFSMALSIVLAVSLLGLSGCNIIDLLNRPNNQTDAPNTNNDNNKDTNTALDNAPYDAYTKKDGTWAIYWYLCGSDIELRENVAYTASGQLQKMMKVNLPDNVTVVIQAGGAKKWHLQGIDPSLTNILVYRGNTLKVMETRPLTNMGDPNTFADFLAYCNLNYPAENQVIMIYDHGGGSLFGIAFDDLYNGDSLTLPEISQVIQARPAASGMYELVDLSACLMSTIDTIAVFNGYARYLTASEEVRLGCAWDYTKVFNVFVNDPKPNGAKLGKVIADGYGDLCVSVGYTAYTTLSVIDMSRADELIAAYTEVGNELLQGAVKNGSEYIASFGRAAYASENYGATQGSTSNYEMVDLGDLVIHAKDLLPKSSDRMLKAIDNAVIYHLTNPLRAAGKGISCYFPYSGNMNSVNRFATLDTSPPWKHYYEYAFTGVLSAPAQDYLSSLSSAPQTPATLPKPDDLGLDGHKLVNPNFSYCTYMLDLGDKAKNVTAVYLVLGIYVPGMADFVMVGARDRVWTQKETSIFYDDFDRKWGYLDNQLCYMEAVSQAPGVVLYRVPVYHNGVEKNLMVAFRWIEPFKNEGTYEILGLITTTSSKFNAAEAVYEILKEGDKIQTILYFYNPEQIRNNEHGVIGTPSTYDKNLEKLITNQTIFEDKDLGDGFYALAFQIIDYTGGIHYSDNGYYLIKDDFLSYSTFDERSSWLYK